MVGHGRLHPVYRRRVRGRARGAGPPGASPRGSADVRPYLLPKPSDGRCGLGTARHQHPRRSRSRFRAEAAGNGTVWSSTGPGPRVTSAPTATSGSAASCALLVELAPREHPVELERLITVAVQKRLLATRGSRRPRAPSNEALQRYGRWPGAGRLARRAGRLHQGRGPQVQAGARLRSVPQAAPGATANPCSNVDIDHWEIDCFWPAHNLAVELDGRPYHVAVKDMETRPRQGRRAAAPRPHAAALHRLPLRARPLRDPERPAALPARQSLIVPVSVSGGLSPCALARPAGPGRAPAPWPASAAWRTRAWRSRSSRSSGARWRRGRSSPAGSTCAR